MNANGQYESWDEGCKDLFGKGIFLAIVIFILILCMASLEIATFVIGMVIMSVVIWIDHNKKNKDDQ
ncbi:MAG: hypothetical protein E7391_04815 [Ruminococcaceae bacterium]|nr:hypothetical protein [Oscillospiraceae bacterium]